MTPSPTPQTSTKRQPELIAETYPEHVQDELLQQAIREWWEIVNEDRRLNGWKVGDLP